MWPFLHLKTTVSVSLTNLESTHTNVAHAPNSQPKLFVAINTIIIELKFPFCNI